MIRATSQASKGRNDDPSDSRDGPSNDDKTDQNTRSCSGCCRRFRAGAGPDLKITDPLDFYAVSDHAEWMGVFKEMANPKSPLSEHPMAARITSDDQNTAMQAFAEVLRDSDTHNAAASHEEYNYTGKSAWR